MENLPLRGEKDIFPSEANEENIGVSAELSDPGHEYSGDSGVDLPRSFGPLQPAPSRFDSKAQQRHFCYCCVNES